MTDFTHFQAVHQQRITNYILTLLPPTDIEPTKLHNAMRYVIENGGKRVRPLLAYATGKVFHIDPNKIDPIAVAVELIHSYSLVHDDLPAMDNDDLRRGKATCHKAFDEATAILVGDALQALAFEVLLTPTGPLSQHPKNLVTMLHLLAKACGSAGMVGGQALDLAGEGKSLSLSELETIHLRKTGALIRATVEMTAIACQATEKEKMALSQFANAIGIAFQIQDDIIDIESDTETLGKPQGADTAKRKSTYPQLLGLDEAKERAQAHYKAALSALSTFGDKAELLRRLASFVVQRKM